MKQFSFRSVSPLLAAAMLVTSGPSVQAGDVGAGIIGGIIGGVISGAVQNANRERTVRREVIIERERVKPRVVHRAPKVDPYTRQQNVQTQLALNYFGFNAGGADGVLGSRSRGAISAFQAYLGFPSTGYLTPQEHAFLASSYQRALATNAANSPNILSNPLGVRVVLPTYWANQTVVAAQTPVVVSPQPVVVAPQAIVPAQQVPQAQQNITINVPQQPQTAQTAQPTPQQGQVQQPPQTQQVAATAVAPTQEQPAAPALPMFVSGPIEVSMSSFCARASGFVAPNAPGELQAIALSDNGESVLASQFCATRTQALVEADQLASTIQGVTRSDMQRQCEAFAPSMDPYVAKLVSEPVDSSRAALQSYVVQSGISLQALSANARICLGIGYSADSARVTLASSMILVGLGEIGLSEVLGYHLAYGFGAPENRMRAAEWLENAAGGVRAGARPVLVDATGGRPDLLVAIATRLRGNPHSASAAVPLGVTDPTTGFQLPGAAQPAGKL